MLRFLLVCVGYSNNLNAFGKLANEDWPFIVPSSVNKSKNSDAYFLM